MNPLFKKIFKFLKKIKKIIDEGKDVSHDNSTPEQQTQQQQSTSQPPIEKQHNQNIEKPTKFSGTPTTEELQTASAALQKLWDLDVRLNININRQGKTTVFNRGDKAKDPLFSSMDLKSLSPSFQSFIALLDNYTKETGKAEKHGSIELEEQKSFIAAVLKTPVGNYLRSYLTGCGVSQNAEKYLIDLWFGLQKRDTHQDSSPFEHVFVGEIRNNKVIGMHNWVQAYCEEQKGVFDYQGFVTSPYKSQYVTNVQFTWHGYMKQVSSMFIGTTPEFELAMYTISYLHIVKNNLESIDAIFDSVPLKITVHTFGKGKIGGAYPEIARQ
eukprot:NODE_204_length_12954_cov_1.347880.p4 type:complete len:326 gc:universal NODE_204_length_12954_cov_1.347880:5988-6965(+)